MKPPAITPPTGVPLATLDEIEALDPDELLEGYRDGVKNEPAPGENRSLAYRHGWWMGMADFNHRPLQASDREIVRQFIARQAAAKPVRFP